MASTVGDQDQPSRSPPESGTRRIYTHSVVYKKRHNFLLHIPTGKDHIGRLPAAPSPQDPGPGMLLHRAKAESKGQEQAPGQVSFRKRPKGLNSPLKSPRAAHGGKHYS